MKAIIGAILAVLFPFLLAFVLHVPAQYAEAVWILSVSAGAFLASWNSLSLKKSIAIALLAWLAVLLNLLNAIGTSLTTIDIIGNRLSILRISSDAVNDPIGFFRSNGWLTYPFMTFLLSAIAGGSVATAVSQVRRLLVHRT